MVKSDNICYVTIACSMKDYGKIQVAYLYPWPNVYMLLGAISFDFGCVNNVVNG